VRICFIALGKFAHIDAYLDYFRERGHEVHFVPLAPGPKRDVPTHNAGFGEGFLKVSGKWSYLPAMLRARKVVRSLAPDVVHAHYATSAGLAAYVCGFHPYLVTAHGTDLTQGIKSSVWRPILRTIFHDADCVNPVSIELRDMVLDLGISFDKVETLTLGIDTKRFSFKKQQSITAPAPLRLICTRRFEEVYDHRTIIKAMVILARQRIDFGLTFAGGGSLKEKLQMQATEQGVRDKITFSGEVRNSRLAEVLADQDIYLSASARDGTSLGLLEAMASGVYPIVSDIKANAEWIKHGCNGHLHKVSDPHSLAESILAFRRDPQTREALRFNRELVVRRGDRSTNMKRLEEVYCNLRLRVGLAEDSGFQRGRSLKCQG
jgi:glycosyltransferase involved in cell wall biosynthesis